MKSDPQGSTDRIDPRLDEITDGLYRVSIKAIIVHDHRLLMTHEPDDWYSLPGGGMLHGSDIEMTLKRELQEEIGLEPANIQVDPRIIDAKFGTVSRGIPRANVYVRVRLADYTQVHDSELEHLWATEEDLDQLLLSPSTSKIVELLKNLLRE